MKINTVSEVSVVTSAMTLVLSVLHEWSYFNFLGNDMFGLISVSDFFSMVLSWLPATLLLVLSMVAYEFSARVIAISAADSFSKKRKKVEGDFKENSINKFNYFVIRLFEGDLPKGILIPFIIVFGILMFIYPGPKIMVVGITFSLGWLMFLTRVFESPLFSEIFTMRVQTVIVCIPIVVVLVASHGAWMAEKDLAAKSGNYTISFNNSSEESGVLLLRSIEKGVLIRFPDEERIGFYPWETISSIDASRVLRLDERLWFCKFAESLCDNKDVLNKNQSQSSYI